jgi:hypothetical protein
MRPRRRGARPPSQGRQRVSRRRTDWHVARQTGQIGGPIQGRNLLVCPTVSRKVPTSSGSAPHEAHSKLATDLGGHAPEIVPHCCHRDCPTPPARLSRLSGKICQDAILCLGSGLSHILELPMHCTDLVVVGRSTVESLPVAHAGGLPPNHCGLSWSRRSGRSRAASHRLVGLTWRPSAASRTAT